MKVKYWISVRFCNFIKISLVTNWASFSRRLFNYTRWRGFDHGDLEGRMIPAASKVVNSFLAATSFSELRRLFLQKVGHEFEVSILW